MRKQILLLILFFVSAICSAADKIIVDSKYLPESKILSGTIEYVFESPKETYKLALYLNSYKHKKAMDIPFVVDQLYKNGFDPAYVNIKPLDEDKIKSVEYYDPEFLIKENLSKDLMGDTAVEFFFNETLEKFSIEFEIYFPEFLMMDFTSDEELFLSRFLWLPSPLEDPDLYQITPFKYDIAIELPEEYVSPNGEQIDKNTWSYSSGDRPSASIPLCILKKKKYDSISIKSGDIEISVWTEKDYKYWGNKVSMMAKGALDYYRDIYGLLDYEKIVIIQGPGPMTASGASDGMVILGGPLYDFDSPIPGLFDPFFDYVVSHELGHLYFGIGCVPDFHRDNFLSESITEYVSCDYIENKYGKETNIFSPNNDIFGELLTSGISHKSLAKRGYAFFFDLLKSGWDFPLGADFEEQISNSMTNVIYSKGMLAMRQAAVNCGKAKFIEMLAKYYSENKHRAVDRDIFLSCIEEVSGEAKKNLQTILDGNIYPDYYFEEFADNKENVEIVVGDKNKTGNRVRLKVKTSVEDYENIIFIGEKVVVKGQVKTAEIDPYWETLDANRKNNALPKKINILNKKYDPLEADLITMDSGFSLLTMEENSDIEFEMNNGVLFESKGITDFILSAGILSEFGIPRELENVNEIVFNPLSGLYINSQAGFPKEISLGFGAKYFIDNSWIAGVSFQQYLYGKFSGTSRTNYIPFLIYQLGLNFNSNMELPAELRITVPLINSPLPLMANVNIEGVGNFLSTSFEGLVSGNVYVFIPILPRFYIAPVIGGGFNFGTINYCELPSSLSILSDKEGGRKIFGKINFMFPIINGLNMKIMNIGSVNGLFGNLYAEAEILNDNILMDYIDPHFGLELSVNFTPLNKIFSQNLALGLVFDIPMLTFDDVSTYKFSISVNEAFTLYSMLESY